MSLAAEIAKEFSPDLLPAILEQLTEEETAELQTLLEADEREDIIRRCSERVVAHDRGPMYWVRNWTKTKNFHWQKQGLTVEQSIRAFPYKPHTEATSNTDWDYLDWIMHYLLDSFSRGYDTYVPKCREMMTSWEAVAYITWSCQFFPNVQAVSQSEKDDKAKGLISYANTLYSNQPDWLKAKFPLKRGEEGTEHKIQWANGSEFIGVPQGERQVASYHPTIYFNDESAHQPAFKATVNIVKPVAKQIICVSSAAMSDFGIECDESRAV